MVTLNWVFFSVWNFVYRSTELASLNWARIRSYGKSTPSVCEWGTPARPHRGRHLMGLLCEDEEKRSKRIPLENEGF